MIEIEFLNRLCKLFSRLSSDYDWGNELNGDIENMEKLCHQYREELKKRGSKKDADGNKTP